MNQSVYWVYPAAFFIEVIRLVMLKGCGLTEHLATAADHDWCCCGAECLGHAELSEAEVAMADS